MELILKPTPLGLGGASSSQVDGAYSLLLSEKEHWKTKCFQLVGSVGPLTPAHLGGSFTPYSYAPPHPHGVCTPPCSWGPAQALHCPLPHARPAQSSRSANRATQVCVEDLRRAAPPSHVSVGTSTPDDSLPASLRVRRALFVPPTLASGHPPSPPAPTLTLILANMESTLALLASKLGVFIQQEDGDSMGVGRAPSTGVEEATGPDPGVCAITGVGDGVVSGSVAGAVADAVTGPEAEVAALGVSPIEPLVSASTDSFVASTVGVPLPAPLIAASSSPTTPDLGSHAQVPDVAAGVLPVAPPLASPPNVDALIVVSHPGTDNTNKVVGVALGDKGGQASTEDVTVPVLPGCTKDAGPTEVASMEPIHTRIVEMKGKGPRVATALAAAGEKTGTEGVEGTVANGLMIAGDVVGGDRSAPPAVGLWQGAYLWLQLLRQASPFALPAPGLSPLATLRSPLSVAKGVRGSVSVPLKEAQVPAPLVEPSFSLPLAPISPPQNPPSAPIKVPRRARRKKRLGIPKFAPLDWATAAAPPSLSGAELRFPKPIAPWDTFVTALEAALSQKEKSTLSKRGIAPAEPEWWCLPRSSIILVNFVRKRLALGTEIGSVVLGYWLDVLIAAGFVPCEGLLAWALDAQNFASSKLVKVFVSHNEWAARNSATRGQSLWATLFTVASLRARTLIPREAPAPTASHTRTVALSGTPAAVTPSHGTKEWGRPNRNAVFLASRPRKVIFQDEASHQAPVVALPPNGGDNGGGASGKGGRSSRGSRGKRAAIGERGPAVTTEAASLPLQAASASSPLAADLLPPIPDEEFPSSTSSAVAARTGWDSDIEEGGGSTEPPSQAQTESAGVSYSEDEDGGDGDWKLVGRERPRPLSPDPPSPHLSSTDSSDILSDQGELDDWGLGEPSSRACSPVASPSKPPATLLEVPLLPPGSSSSVPSKRAAKFRRQRLARSAGRKLGRELEAAVMNEAVSLFAADMAALPLSQGETGTVVSSPPDPRPVVLVGADPNASVEVDAASEAVACVAVDSSAHLVGGTESEVGEGLVPVSAADTDTATDADSPMGTSPSRILF